MISPLHGGDRLTQPSKPESYWEVISGAIHAGTIEIFDSEKRTARYVDESAIRAGISAGTGSCMAERSNFVRPVLLHLSAGPGGQIFFIQEGNT